MCGRTRALGSAWVSQQGQQCEVHRDSLAHAHKTIGRRPHRLPSRGNPGILLYVNDMTSASASGRHTLGASATGISVQLTGSSRSPTSSVPIIRFQIGPEMTRLTSRHADQGSYAICRAELGYKPGLRHPPSLQRAMYETDRKSCTIYAVSSFVIRISDVEPSCKPLSCTKSTCKPL